MKKTPLLLKAEGLSTELQNDFQRLKALLYFLGDFFEYETLDPNSTDDLTCARSASLLMHYREYQSIFEIAYNTVCSLNTSVGALSDTISMALDDKYNTVQ